MPGSTYEDLLQAVNLEVESLSDVQRKDSSAITLPLVFLVGVPRSGSTLLYQLLCQTHAFGYCSNLIARFYRNPAFGARVQKMLAPLLEREEIEFNSEFGRTERWHEPHEFGYFWEHHLPFEEHHDPSADELKQVDWTRLVTTIAEFQREFAKPLVFKNLLLSFVASHLSTSIPESRFVHVTRAPLDVSDSLYRARLAELGAANEWFSIRPRCYAEWSDCTPIAQIAKQIRSVHVSLNDTRDNLAASRWLEVSYHDICESPRLVVKRVLRFAGIEGPLNLDALPSQFEQQHAQSAKSILDELETHLRSHQLL